MKYALGETEHKHTHPHSGAVGWHKTSKFTRSYWKEESRRAEEIAYDRIYSSLAVGCWWHYLNKVNPIRWQSLIIDLILHFCQNLHYLSRSMWTPFKWMLTNTEFWETPSHILCWREEGQLVVSWFWQYFSLHISIFLEKLICIINDTSNSVL